MRRLRSLLALTALAVSAWLSVASMMGSDDDDGPQWTPQPDPPPAFDETYLVENLWDGQTSVPLHQTFELTVGTRDLVSAEEAFGRVHLEDLDAGQSLPLQADIGTLFTVLTPVSGLPAAHDLVLRLGGLEGYLVVRRWVPGDLRFSTRTAPRLVSLWRSDDTLMLVFSEPMNGATLRLGHGSVDLLREDADGATISLAATANLANFAWDTVDEMFRLAPLDLVGPVWLTVSSSVQSERGVRLDDDQDGLGGGVEDDVVVVFDPATLPTCSTRVDIPDPCVNAADVPDLRW